MNSKPERYRWLIELSSVKLAARWQKSPLIIEASVTANLVLVRDVAYARFVSAAWQQWASNHLHQPKLLFNWISVFNFNRDARSYLLALDVAQHGAQALMMLRDCETIFCDSAPRGPLVYIAFIEVAPWNHPGVQDRPLSGLGPIMLRAAADLSLQLGYGGRIGLHSVPAAEDFYRRLKFEQFDCPNEYNEVYYELNDSSARELLSE